MRKILSFVMVLVLLLGLSCGVAFAGDTGPGITELNTVLDLINGASVYAVAVIGILGFLAFCLSMFVEATKGIPFIRKLPTDLYVILVSLVFCEVLLFIVSAFIHVPVQWYYVALTIFMSLAVSFISMFGWTKATALWLRFSKPKR